MFQYGFFLSANPETRIMSRFNVLQRGSMMLESVIFTPTLSLFGHDIKLKWKKRQIFHLNVGYPSKINSKKNFRFAKNSSFDKDGFCIISRFEISVSHFFP